MNLRAIKIIDLDHSVLDNSAVERIEESIKELNAEAKSIESKIAERKTDIDELKNLQFKSKEDKKEAERTGKITVINETVAGYNDELLAIGYKVADLVIELRVEKESIVEEQRRGVYRFKHKACVNYRDAGRRPPWKFMWCHYSDFDNYGMYREWQISFGSTAVTINKDRYVPEGVPVNSEGHFVFKDVILMKEDLQKYLLRQQVARARGEGAGRAELDALDSEFASQGANLSDKHKEELLSSEGR